MKLRFQQVLDCSALSESIAQRRREAMLIKERANLLASRIGLPKSTEATKLAKGTVKERSNIGKNMQRVGTALLIIPDPITGAAGVPLLAVGKALQMRQGTNIAETYQEFNQTMKALRRASSEK